LGVNDIGCPYTALIRGSREEIGAYSHQTMDELEVILIQWDQTQKVLGSSGLKSNRTERGPSGIKILRVRVRLIAIVVRGKGNIARGFLGG
jgi:hypothetical protein